MPNHSLGSSQLGAQQMQEKYLAVGKQIYMAFVDLEKAFDRVPQKAIWWAMRKEWIVKLVQGNVQECSDW